MTDASRRIVEAWRAAAADLGIRVTAPFALPGPRGGAPVEFLALVHDFGAPAGALVCAAHDWDALESAGGACGYFVSGLYPDAYANYDRGQFIDTLEDWGWFGGGPPPSWYAGVSPWQAP